MFLLLLLKMIKYLVTGWSASRSGKDFFFAWVTVIPLTSSVRLPYLRAPYWGFSAPRCWLRCYSSQDAACDVRWTARSTFDCLICWIGINRLVCFRCFTLPKDTSQPQTQLLCSRRCIYQTAPRTDCVHKTQISFLKPLLASLLHQCKWLDYMSYTVYQFWPLPLLSTTEQSLVHYIP